MADHRAERPARHPVQQPASLGSRGARAPQAGRAVRTTEDDYESFAVDGTVPPGVRDLVAESWRRSAAAGLDAASAAAPLALNRSELTGYREAHPLSLIFPLLYDVLGRSAEELDSLMALGDENGRLLWVCGRPSVLARAEQINFAEGTAWEEQLVGTNAPGTALRLDAPVLITATEHFSRPVQLWTCAAAPIHDPVTGAVIGVIDITGGKELAAPQTMGLIRAAARLAESELGRLSAVNGGGGLAMSSQPAALSLEALGRPDCQVQSNGRTRRLSARHSEIMVLLTDHPDGLTGEQLAVELYEGDVSMSTVRAELTRLRSLLGADLLDSRPYRLRVSPQCDWLTVSARLEANRVAEALRAYRGPLLPQSDAPGVIERRDLLERQLRSAVYASGELDLMVSWTRSRWGADDMEMWEQQARRLPECSPLRPLAEAEVRRLDDALRWRG